jgi:hypothetical protein
MAGHVGLELKHASLIRGLAIYRRCHSKYVFAWPKIVTETVPV